jgi:twitching motility protein PilT
MNKTMKKHIITLEDPIEYLHKHGNCIIDQREIGFDTNNFANGLRAALRQDPDVILVGEMRDLETIHTAITAAETGHLVFGTLHTSSAPDTINRMIDVFPPEQQQQIRIQLASVLVAVISQRLFPMANKQGRIAATEILINNSAVANLIRNEKIHQIVSVMQTSKALGMHTLESNIKELVQTGMIDRDIVEPYLQERGE